MKNATDIRMHWHHIELRSSHQKFAHWVSHWLTGTHAHTIAYLLPRSFSFFLPLAFTFSFSPSFYCISPSLVSSLRSLSVLSLSLLNTHKRRDTLTPLTNSLVRTQHNQKIQSDTVPYKIAYPYLVYYVPTPHQFSCSVCLEDGSSCTVCVPFAYIRCATHSNTTAHTLRHKYLHVRKHIYTRLRGIYACEFMLHIYIYIYTCIYVF